VRAVVQRVSQAAVQVGDRTTGSIGSGLLVLLGVGRCDETEDACYLADKVANLRVFPDAEGKMNLSLLDIGGQALVVSQFTLYGDCRRGRRPSFSPAAPPERAEELYGQFVHELESLGLEVATGRFQETMMVHLTNWGPVTLLLDSKKEF